MVATAAAGRRGTDADTAERVLIAAAVSAWLAYRWSWGEPSAARRGRALISAIERYQQHPVERRALKQGPAIIRPERAWTAVRAAPTGKRRGAGHVRPNAEHTT